MRFMLLTAMLLLSPNQPAIAQAPDGAGPSQAQSPNQIRAALETIASLLADQTEVQRSSLLLERLRIESESLQIAESELRAALERRDSVDAQIRQMQVRMDVEEDRLFSEGEGTLGPDAERELAQMRTELELVVARLEREKTTADTRVIEIENAVYDRRIKHETLRQRVDDILDIDGP